MTEKVAIILINWNSFHLTNDCIKSLGQIEYPNTDIIVVDNGSADGSGDKLKSENEKIILIKSEMNTGFTGGNNLGLRYSLENGYTYSMLLNNDTFVEPDFLGPLVDFLNTHPEVGAIQPRIFFHHDRKLIWNGGSGYNKLLGYTYTRGYNKPSNPKDEIIRTVDWITGCAFLTRNNILRETGLLTEKFFIYYEDVDLSFRIKALGYKLVYHPLSIVYHIAGMANKNKAIGREGQLNPIVHYLSSRNRIWLLKKYTPWYLFPGVFLYNCLRNTGIIIYFALRFRFKKLVAVLNGIKDGLLQPLT